MVSDVSISTALSQQQNTSESSSALADDFSQFLTLLTVQLQNQDPLSPMETNEFTNQLVAFTGVEQQINTNQKLDSLVALQISNSFSSAQSYVGKDVSYVASEFDYSGNPSTLRYSLDSEATYSQINILNEAGEVVYNTDGAESAGAHEFVWNGQTNSGEPAVPGTYELVVDALDANEDPINVTSVVTGNVRGAETQGGTIYLLVGERAVPVSSILNTSQDTTTSSNNSSLTSALSYIGLDVSYQNSQINHRTDSVTHNIIYNLETEADRAKLVITDSSGTAVYTGDVGTNSGQNITSWDGLRSDGSEAPAGTYYYSINALDEDDQTIGFTSLSEGIVQGIESENGVIYLDVNDTTIPLDQIVSVNVGDEI